MPHNIYLIDLPILIVLTSLVYSATRYDTWPAIALEAVRWGLRLGVFMFAIVVLLLLTSWM